MFAVVSALLLLVCQHAWADDDWKVLGLQSINDEQSGGLFIERLYWQGDHVDQLFYRCPEQLTVYPIHSCDKAALSFEYAGQKFQVAGKTRFDWSDKHWMADVKLSDANVYFKLDSADPQVLMNLDKVNPLMLVERFVGLPEWARSIGMEFSGLVTHHLLSGQSSTQEASFSGLDFEYSTDIIVAGLGGTISAELDQSGQQMIYQITLNQGEMLFDQLYVNFVAYPVSIRGQLAGLFTDEITFSTAVNNRQSLQSAVTGVIRQDELIIRKVDIKVPDSHHFNQQILASVLRIYGFGQTEMSGGFSLSAAFDPAGVLTEWQLLLDDYYLLNDRRKLQADAMTGVVNWGAQQPVEHSQMRWQQLVLAGMPVNQSQVEFIYLADQFALNGIHEFPVFDGSIQLRDFTADGLLSDAVDLSLKATIAPISLRLITEKLGWPEMSGSISGDIPGLVKRGQVIEFLGGLNLAVFQGQMKVDNLSMERLFGVAPVIAADISFSGFDLAQLTETFGFGRITGLLSGEVNGLRITNWKTDRLDARVYTVKTKGVKQTISQRAIDNISSLGGIKGAISNTFLRFFDDFRYQKIKLSCVLHNSVCQIGGLKNQGNQFVIVEGGGIPKINIVGFVRSINWEEFIDRLLNANYGN